MDPTFIARVAHEADRALVATHGAIPQKVWLALDAWERESAIRGVKAAIANPELGAPALHELWRHDKLGQGWSRAESFDLKAKHDPILVPWDQLPARAQRRDELFVAVVRALGPTP